MKRIILSLLLILRIAASYSFPVDLEQDFASPSFKSNLTSSLYDEHLHSFNKKAGFTNPTNPIGEKDLRIVTIELVIDQNPIFSDIA